MIHLVFMDRRSESEGEASPIAMKKEGAKLGS